MLRIFTRSPGAWRCSPVLREHQPQAHRRINPQSSPRLAGHEETRCRETLRFREPEAVT